MKNKNISVFTIIALIFSLSLYGSEKMGIFAKSRAMWEKSCIKEYYIKVNYSSFSPISGLWELEVKNGKIINCMFNGKPADNCAETAGSFTMENLYRTAGRSSAADKNGPFIIEVTYGENGFINSLARIRNPEYKKRVQKDTTYRIEVLDFIPGGG
jgi:hypothetical protein